MQGWIKLHRQLLIKGYANKPAYVSLWVHLLLLANHTSGHEFLWNDQLLKLKPGQFVTGRKELSIKSGIPETTVERILNIFEKNGQIGQQKTSKYRLITILNWDKHQIVDNRRTTDGQQTDTFKNERMKEPTSGAIAPAESKLPTNNKDMFGTQSDDYLEGVVDYDGDGALTPEKKPNTRKYPNAPAVRKVFQEKLGRNPANWKVNKTQLQACENLYTERGIESIKNALEFYKEKQDQEYCPSIDSPYDLDSKWVKLGKMKLKQN